MRIYNISKIVGGTDEYSFHNTLESEFIGSENETYAESLEKKKNGK